MTDSGYMKFDGNIVLMANMQEFSTFNAFLPTLTNTEFSSNTLTSQLDVASTGEINMKLRVLTTNTSFSGQLYAFITYNSNSSDLKYLNFTDLIMIPVTVTPGLNSVTVTGNYFLDQRVLYDMSDAVLQKYTTDAFAQYILFNNAHWLNFQLQQTGRAVEAPALSFDEPVQENTSVSPVVDQQAVNIEETIINPQP